MDDAKSIHKCLRTAAGIFKAVKEKYVLKIDDKGQKTDDTDDRVLEAYLHQCTGEAQEGRNLKNANSTYLFGEK